MKGKRLVSLLLLIALCVTTFLSSITPTVEGAVVGTGKSLPTGGIAGPGGGVNLTPVYRVGLAKETLSGNNKLDETMTNDLVVARIKSHFNNHYPRIERSIFFAYADNHSTNSMIAWYSASAGQLNPIIYDAVYYQKKLRKIDTSNTRSQNLFFDKLLQKAPFSTEEDTMANKLGNMQWQKVITETCSTNCVAQAAAVWNFIFKNPEKIHENLRIYIGEDVILSTPLDQHNARLKYLDLLMTIYLLMPAEEDQQFVAGEIERYINMVELDTRPVLVSIDTVSRFYAPNYSSKYYYIPSIDFVLWAHGATPRADLREADFNAGSAAGNTKNLISESARISMAEQPSRDRTTSQSGENNAFKYGYNGVTGWLFSTSSGVPVWGSRGSVSKGIMEVLDFSGNGQLYGFMIAGIQANKPDISGIKCKCSQTVALPNKAEVEGRLEGNIVGKFVELTINMKESDPNEREKWDKLLKDATDLQMKVQLWRSQAPGVPKWLTAGGTEYLNTAEFVTVDPKTIKAYLDGELLHFRDDLRDYKIPDEQTIEFRYNASIHIRGKDKKGREFNIQCSAGESQFLFITGPNKYIPETGAYSSSPVFWSEIKQGSPGNEKFEAMAGTPTTEHLYFATGGSEFIVDVEVEYVPDATSTRKYRSYFSGVPSEFKDGDKAPDYTVPAPSGASSSSLTVNGHLGGTVTATWTGTIPYIGSVTWGDHWTNVDNRWDETPYETAKKQAQDWINTLNNFEISHKAASDGIVRKFKNWGASITSDSKTLPAGWANPGRPEVWGSCGYPATPCIVQSYVPASGQNGKDGQYSITVTARLPARIIDGPSSVYDLPPIEDTWTQTVTYDYTKITKAKVWKIDRSTVNGMRVLTDADDEITATIQQGDPTIFMNIADPSKLATGASRQNRLRYSLEPDMHDEVVWYEGPRTNKDDGRGDNGLIKGPGQSASWATGIIYTNNTYSDTENYHALHSTDKDKLTPEYKRFHERRTALMEVTAISDFLILQTSGGDQAVLYFEKTSPKIQAQQQADIPKTSFDEQWTNNEYSAAQWDKHHIHVGSYNGNYATPNSKYSTYGTTKVPTIFDADRLPAGFNRTARPTAALRLVKTGIDIVDTKPNKEYVTGNSEVFYKLIVDEGKPNTIFPTTMNAKYGDRGVVFQTTYSDNHGKVNNIVIHNPVSTEYAMVVTEDHWVDQRTASTSAVGGNLQPITYNYERRLKEGYVFTPTPPVYEEQVVPNPNYVPPAPAQSWTFNYTGSVQKFKAPRSGTYTIEAWGAEGGGISTPVQYEWYNEYHNVYIWYPSNTGHEYDHCINHISRPTGRMMGGTVTGGGLGGYAKGQVHLHADEELYIHVGGSGANGMAGVASGGWNGGGNGYYHSGGGGGASDVRRNGTGLADRILVAGGGGGSTATENHSHHARGGSGGGLVGLNGQTHGYWSVEFTSTGGTQTAGGNVGGKMMYQWYNPYHGVYIWYDSPTGYTDAYCSYDHPSYYTGVSQLMSNYGNPGTLGAGGNFTHTYQGGGGGGYYGGASGAYHGYSGAGGSGYIGGVQDGEMETGVRSGHGMVKISAPAFPGIGSPTMIERKMVRPGIYEPPEDAYEYVLIENNPARTVLTPEGPREPGKFIYLDHEFRIYFPNKGNFYGNGAYGLHSTSPITGKGFINEMDTSDWTARKQVKFDFYVTYNGVTYAPGEWIDLVDVHQDYYTFYSPLANREAISALVEFRAIANNAFTVDNDYTERNKERYENLAARHNGIKRWNIDLIGKIGALVIEDTGDFRFSNLFKQPVSPEEWLVPNVVRKVDPGKQNRIVGDTKDVRLQTATAPGYLDTYGLLGHLRQSPIPLPLSPSINTIAALQRQPMRIGYSVFSDIQTIGNYYHRLQIIPYYYMLDLNKPSGSSGGHAPFEPVDIYMNVNGEWRAINKFGVAQPGWDPSAAGIYDHIYTMDWEAEQARRNVSAAEMANTNAVADATKTEDANGNEVSIDKPYGKFHAYGTAQLMHLTGRNRTFIGTEYTNGVNRNPGSAIPEIMFGMQAQRWHFTFGLPSSAVAVRAGQQPTADNIRDLRNNKTVLLVALDIKSIGDTYVLQYDKPNGTVEIAGETYHLSAIPYPVVAVYSAEKTSGDDLSVTGTH